MLIWIIFAVMTGAAVFALLWPLGHGREAVFADAADAKSLYRAQLGEIERDLARRLIGPTEAEAARTEAARRLLRASGDEAGPAGETESSLRRRRASSALALSCVPLLALLVYGAYGSPGIPISRFRHGCRPIPRGRTSHWRCRGSRPISPATRPMPKAGR